VIQALQVLHRNFLNAASELKKAHESVQVSLEFYLNFQEIFSKISENLIEDAQRSLYELQALWMRGFELFTVSSE
jgi:hypothetical protein